VPTPKPVSTPTTPVTSTATVAVSLQSPVKVTTSTHPRLFRQFQP
jgi:hypothetical protein